MDYVIVGVVSTLILCAIRYIVKAKKKGAKCIGCSASECHCSDGKKNTCECCNGTDKPE